NTQKKNSGKSTGENYEGKILKSFHHIHMITSSTRAFGKPMKHSESSALQRLLTGIQSMRE
ncbi:hypothetical protein OFN71_23590, partial [Escherichia coli]|nr:hypothetical protein [Escherichia coli]